MATTQLFADLGIRAYQTGQLDDGLALLAARLDLAGAGDLLDDLMFTCWAAEHGPGQPGCRCEKKPPDPRPLPKPPPRPPKGDTATRISGVRDWRDL